MDPTTKKEEEAGCFPPGHRSGSAEGVAMPLGRRVCRGTKALDAIVSSEGA